MNTLIRYFAADMPTTQMVFLRNLFSTGLMLPWVLWRGAGALKTKRLKSHFWRACVGILAMELWFHSLALMPVAKATALSFTTPLFVTVAAVLFFGETIGIHRIGALIVGFAGVLLITQPGANTFEFNAFFVLAASAMIGMATLLVKSLTRTEHPNLIVFYMALFMTLLSLPPALPYLRAITGIELGGMIAIAAFSTLAQGFLARAYPHAEMVVLMPFDFTRLIFTALLAYAMFGETLEGHTVLGAAIIAASSVYITYREALYKRLHSKKIDRQGTTG